MTRTYERTGITRLGTVPLGGSLNPTTSPTPTTGLIMPTIAVQVSFTDPWQTPDWVDITRWVQSAQTKRGRQHELQRAVAGTAALQVYNQDGRFSTFNKTGPYVNLLSGADSYFLDGSTGTWGNTTNCTATLSTGVGLDGTSALALASVASGNMSATSGASTGGYAVTVGSIYTAMASFKAASSARTVRIDIAWYNGASLLSTSTGTTVTDNTTGFTKATVTGKAPASTTTATVVVTVLSTAAAGEVHNVQRIALFTGDQYGTASSGWAPGGRGGLTPTRTVRITATWSGTTYPVYQGFVDAWIPAYDTTKSLQTINCVDMFSILALGYLLNPNYYPAIVPNAASPTAYYRCSDTIAPTVADSSGNGNNALIAGTAALGAAGVLLYDTNAAIDLSNGTTSTSAFITLPPVAQYIAGSWTWEFWFKTSSSSTQGLMHWGCNASGTQAMALNIVGGVLTLQWGNQYTSSVGPTLGGTLFTGTATVTDGNWHHVSIQMNVPSTNGASTFTIYQDGVSIGSGGNVTTWTGVALVGGLQWNAVGGGGYLSGTAPTFVGSVDEIAVYGSLLGTTGLAARVTAGNLFRKVESSGTRVKSVLTVMGVPTAYQNIAGGQSQVQNETSSLTTQQALSYIQTVEKAEAGFSYVDESGVFTFRGRNYTWNGISQTTVDSTTSATNLHAEPGSVVPEADSVDLWNSIPVSARANPTYGITGATQTGTDLDSQSWHGKRSLTGFTGFLLTSDFQAAALAQYLVNRYGRPQARVKSASISSLVDKGRQFPQMLGRLLLDRVTVNWQPLDGTSAAFTQSSYVESIAHDIQPASWTTTWALTPAEAQYYFKLDDHTYGVLTGTGVTTSGELCY